MKKKLFLLLLVVTFVAGFTHLPSSTNAAEMYPKITSIQPVNFVSLSQ